MTKRLTFLCLICLWNLAGAQDLVAQDLVITNARILDGTGATIEQGSIVVRDGRLVSVSAGPPEAQGHQRSTPRA